MSDIYYDTYNEGEAPEEEKSKLSKILSLIWKTVSVLLVCTVFFLIFYRIFEMQEPRGIGELIFSEKTLALLNEQGSDQKVTAEYSGGNYVFEKETLTTVTLTKKSENGEEDYETVEVPVSEYYESSGFVVFEAGTGFYAVVDEEGKESIIKRTGYYEVKDSPVEGALHVSHIYLIPSAKQVQVTFRYKSDSLEKLNGQVNLNGEEFTYTLRDDRSNTYGDYSYRTAKKGVYRYITMVFDKVELSSVKELFLDVGYLTEDGKEESLAVALYDDNLPYAMKKYDLPKSREATKLTPFVQKEN